MNNIHRKVDSSLLHEISWRLRYTISMTFSEQLLKWYHDHKRELPFRSQRDPYKIWVSEIMAQQTQIATMLPYYERWIEKYPDVFTLANAELEEVLKMWEGLGYYSRARNLHKGAIFVVEEFNGVLPADKKELMRIPGIGDYTSSAIASIAFGLPEVVIDGNVKRVTSRYLYYTETVMNRKAHKTFDEFLKEELISSQADPNEYNQALMELGALVCKPKNPQCDVCPFKDSCLFNKTDKSEDIPFIPKAKPTPVYPKTVFVSIRDHQILLSNDDQDGLMKGLYRLPMIDEHNDTKADAKLLHKFSHLQWDINAYLIDRDESEENGWFYVSLEDLVNHHPLVTAHKKILQKLNIID